MSKDSKILLAFMIFCVATCIIITINTKPVKQSNYERVIDSLNNKIDSIQNKRIKIISTIDSNDTKIVNVRKEYYKTVDNIIHQSFDSDSVYFTNYIDRYRKNHDSDSSAIKDN